MQLALKLHPDKNTAPGADDAFKGNFGALDIILYTNKNCFSTAVGTAYGILSDGDKRAHYDKVSKLGCFVNTLKLICKIAVWK